MWMKLSLVIGIAASVTATAVADEIPLFASDTVVEMTLDAVQRDLKRAKKEEDPIPGTLTVSTDTGVQAFDVKLTVRGKFRLENCRYPPIWVNFKKSKLDDTLFAGQNRLKLVTHCNKGDRYDKLLLKEYLVYKMLNLMTPKSYRVRLARVTYLDAGKTDQTQYAFFIEHARTLAPRTGLDRLKVEKIRGSELAFLDATRVELFAYMIGHTDWAGTQGPPDGDCCHNAHLYVPAGVTVAKNTIVPVPYDFDITGFVNPPYAEINQDLGIRNVRQRLYRGLCRAPTLLDQVVVEFVAKRSELMALVEDFELLNEKERSKVAVYLTGFFNTLEDSKKFERQVVGKCRGSLID